MKKNKSQRIFRGMLLTHFCLGLLNGLDRSAWARDDVATVTPLEGKGIISGLTIKNSNSPITGIIEEDKWKVVLQLKGTYERPEWSLLCQKALVKVAENGEFSIELPINGALSKVVFETIDPKGQVEQETVQIYAPTWAALADEINTQKVGRFPVKVELGPSLASYNQTHFNSLTKKTVTVAAISEVALTFNASYIHRFFSPHWEYVLNTHITLLPITHSSTLGNDSIRFLGINGKIGYILPPIKRPWRAGIYAGIYYSTTFVPRSAYGYSSISGPQIVPMVSRELGARSSAAAFFRFSTINRQAFPSYGLFNREISLGGEYDYTLHNGHILTFGFEYMDFALTVDSDSITAQQTSFNVGYRF